MSTAAPGTGPAAAADTDVEAALKEVELNELEQEKLPMGLGLGLGLGDTNGAVKVLKAGGGEPGPKDKFTGLSKEELLKVAGSPAWVRGRWLLLILFWLGWLGMLAGAVAIIVQAPRCRPLPPGDWWRTGGIYQLQVAAFQDSDGDGEGDLAGVGERMEEIAALKVKGIIIGPIHQTLPDNINKTNLTEIDSKFGNLEQMERLLETARRKGIKVILDLTPNYRGKQEWFGVNFNRSDGSQDLLQEKEAFQYWLQKGVDGLCLRGIEQVLSSAPSRVEEWQNLTKSFTEDENPRAFIVATVKNNSGEILQLVNQSDSDLLFSYYLREALVMSKPPAAANVRQKVEKYIESCGETWPSWAVGGYEVGHIASTLEQYLQGLVQVMLFTLPGTPFIYYGDEIGLEDNQLHQNKQPWMLWNASSNGGFTSKSSFISNPPFNRTVQGQLSPPSPLSLFKKLSLLKIKERSLLFGDFESLYSVGQVFAYKRIWDQSDRFIVLLNFGQEPESVSLKGNDLPTEAWMELSSETHRKDETVSLTGIHLAGGEGLILKFPFVA
ncbi:solute carrier family 3 member 2b [Carcharodon carcharias]|uniref:solute carrier family 3 member 2b n=1 Tax=Carcharodon carcharias TaxID=13397 RepID=UPI001B7EB4B8|nr:solute carrier family 3 member 2b [Carcharodon carcharias]